MKIHEKNAKLLKSNNLISLMNEEYRNYLTRIVEKLDVTDKSGKIIIGKDLKVTHKPSGYEYTVSKVLQDDNVGIKIVLREPEVPRKSVLKNIDNDKNRHEGEGFVIDQKEFENNYKES